MLKAYETLGKIAAEEAETGRMTGIYMQKLAEAGFPGMMSGISEAPYDILGDYFRGTMGIFEGWTSPCPLYGSSPHPCPSPGTLYLQL
jgi:hypothetical protein